MQVSICSYTNVLRKTLLQKVGLCKCQKTRACPLCSDIVSLSCGVIECGTSTLTGVLAVKSLLTEIPMAWPM